MGGGDGGTIVSHAIKDALNDPIVHGSLPAGIQKEIAVPRTQEPGEWTPEGKKAMHHAFNWAMSNL